MSSAAASAAAPSAVDPAHALASAEQVVQQQQQQLQQQHADLQRIMSEHQAVQARLAIVESERAHAHASAAASAAEQARNGSRPVREEPLPKIPPPEQFNGTNGPAVDSWIHGMEKQFSYYRRMFATEESKIAYASNFLNKLSSAWLTNLNLELARPDRVPITTWYGLTEHMRERYQPMQSSTIARQRLDTFVQKSSVQVYVEHFYACMVYIKDMGETDQIHQFVRGLKTPIKLEVMRHSPENVNEAINCAVKAESYLGLSGPALLSTGGSNRYSRFGQQSSASSNSGHVAMDINNVDMFTLHDESNSVVDDESAWESSSAGAAAPPAWAAHIQAQTKMNQKILALFGDHKKSSIQKTSSSNGKVPNISKDVFNRCRLEGRCIKCKQTGHVARECTNPAANF